MTNDDPKRPFYKNREWIRSVIIGEAVIFGGLIALWGVLCAIDAFIFGGMLFYLHWYRYFILILFLPFFLPVYIEAFFLQIVFNIRGEEMMLYTIPMFASLVLWWIFLGVVLGSVIYRVRLNRQRKKEREAMSKKTYKSCQSCAMPMKHDPEKGGTEADGTKSAIYCSYCYKDGKFTDDFTTAGQMQEFCKQKLVEMKFPKIVAWLFTRSIPRLKRWKQG